VIGVRIRNNELSPVKCQNDTTQDESDMDAEEVNEGRWKYFEVVLKYYALRTYIN
jgi:hypothetical protein